MATPSPPPSKKARLYSPSTTTVTTAPPSVPWQTPPQAWLNDVLPTLPLAPSTDVWLNNPTTYRPDPLWVTGDNTPIDRLNPQPSPHPPPTSPPLDLLHTIIRRNSKPPLHTLALPCLSILHQTFHLPLNTTTSKTTTLLSLAATKGFLNIVTYLLSNGAAPNLPNAANGATPLLQACHYGHHNVVSSLLESGAVSDLYNDNRTTPLMRAAQEGFGTVCELLLEDFEKRGMGRGAVDGKNTDGMSAVALASQRGHVHCVSLLVRAGGSVNGVTTQLSTPLMLATKRAHVGTIRFLLGRGGHTFRRCARGRNARNTSERKRLKLTTFLIDNNFWFIGQRLRRDAMYTYLLLAPALCQEHVGIPAGGSKSTGLVVESALTLDIAIFRIILSFVRAPPVYKERFAHLSEWMKCKRECSEKEYYEDDSTPITQQLVDLCCDILKDETPIFDLLTSTCPIGFADWGEYRGALSRKRAGEEERVKACEGAEQDEPADAGGVALEVDLDEGNVGIVLAEGEMEAPFPTLTRGGFGEGLAASDSQITALGLSSVSLLSEIQSSSALRKSLSVNVPYAVLNALSDIADVEVCILRRGPDVAFGEKTILQVRAATQLLIDWYDEQTC